MMYIATVDGKAIGEYSTYKDAREALRPYISGGCSWSVWHYPSGVVLEQSA